MDLRVHGHDIGTAVAVKIGDCDIVRPCDRLHRRKARERISAEAVGAGDRLITAFVAERSVTWLTGRVAIKEENG